MGYEFPTSIGMFRIRPDPVNPGGVVLSIDDIAVAKYDSPEAAARAVYAQETGWDRWDMLQNINGPRDLTEWNES